MLTAVVLTHDEERHLHDCLASLAWAPAVLVFDSYSRDRTLAVAQAAGARVVQHAFENYASQRQAALEACDSEWVLFVDADERVPPALAAEVQAVLAQPEPAWWIPRHNYIFGRLTLHAGWYPDYQLRLLRRALARYDPSRPVHELALLESTLAPGRLASPLIHLNYETVGEFVDKQRYYARYDAGRLLAEGRRARPHNFVLQPWRQFIWRWVTLQGWRAGWHGLRLSVLMAYFEWQKYRELRRLQAKP
jgi:glycosyltransferase involved in cell wall biosynthesis